jgi:putative lipoprotein (rSAM/lipoprotein system)
MARVSKIYRVIISSLLALLGFSCGGFDFPWDYPQPAEYGMPSATYKAKGVVVSEADNSPIKGIKTVLEDGYDHYPIAFSCTNDDGSFSLEVSDYFHQKLCVKLIDIDGEENGGLFAEMEIEADYTNATFKGGSGWYKGEAEIDLKTINMKLENKSENSETKDET